MKMNEKLIKPLTETKYLNVDNTDRYRPIIRLFYLEYEKLRYWMYPEEVFEELHKEEYFKDYTEEQCRQDLEVLKNWGNLSAIQDTKRVNSIEEFKNKKYRYQLTDYSVEIERTAVNRFGTGNGSARTSPFRTAWFRRRPTPSTQCRRT